MATSPVLQPPGVNMPGMGSSNFVPMGGSANNPTGAAGGSSTASGVPMASTPGAGTAGVINQAGNIGATGSGLSNNLASTYGQGVGDYVSNLIGTGGMNVPLVQQTNAAEINGMQGQVNAGSANLAATLGAQGVSGNSSTNALAQSNYQGQVAAQENSLISQNYMSEYNQGQQLLQSILGSVLGQSAQNEADKFNWEDALNLGVSGAGLLAGVPGLGSIFSSGKSSDFNIDNSGMLSDIG